jgi:hypothetical protein
MDVIYAAAFAAPVPGSVGEWFIAWVQTPGFGGAAAVLAAVVAFGAAWHQAGVQRHAQRKEQWWKRAEWALNLTLSNDSATRSVGFHTLEALSESEWAAEHEGDVIAAATDHTLDSATRNLGLLRRFGRQLTQRSAEGGR